MTKPLRILLAALLAALLLPTLGATGAKAHDRVAGPLYRMLGEVCERPGFSLEERVAILQEWRPATAEEAAQIVPAAAQASIATQVLRGVAEPAARDALIEDRARGLQDLVNSAETTGPEAARLLVLDQNSGLALLMETVDGGGLAVLSCQLLLRAPGRDVIEDLVSRYDVLPPRSDETAHVWAGQSVFETATQIQTYKRGLVLLRQGQGTSAAVVHTSLTVETR